MPYDDPDPTDPNVLVGVLLPGNAETMREMAYAFAEEFARMGHDHGQIETLFKTPFYAGAHRAYLALGEAEIQTIINECVAAWGGVVIRDRDSCPSRAGVESTSTNTVPVRSVQDDLNDLNDWNRLNPRREESDDG